MRLLPGFFSADLLDDTDFHFQRRPAGLAISLLSMTGHVHDTQPLQQNQPRLRGTPKFVRRAFEQTFASTEKNYRRAI